MSCIACGNGHMHEEEVGRALVATCHACGASIRGVLASSDFALVDRDYDREFMAV